MSGGVKIIRKDLGIGKLRQQLKELDSSRVDVGVQGEAAAKRHPNSEATVGEVAAWVHYGTVHIPPRPYLDHAIAAFSVDRKMITKRVISDLVDGRKTSVEETLVPIGEALLAAVRSSIDSAISWAAPLALSTIKKKGSAAPLVDSGTLRDSTTYKITKGVLR